MLACGNCGGTLAGLAVFEKWRDFGGTLEGLSNCQACFALFSGGTLEGPFTARLAGLSGGSLEESPESSQTRFGALERATGPGLLVTHGRPASQSRPMLGVSGTHSHARIWRYGGLLGDGMSNSADLRQRILERLKTRSSSQVAKDFGIGTRTVERIIEESKSGAVVERLNRTESPSKLRAAMSAAEAKAVIASEIIAGRWSYERIPSIAKALGRSQREIRFMALDVASECRASLDPHRIAMGLLEDIERLRLIGIRAERMARDSNTCEGRIAALNAAASAFQRAGNLGATLVKGAMLANSLAPQSDESTGLSEAEVRAELVRRGWTPPVETLTRAPEAAG